MGDGLPGAPRHVDCLHRRVMRRSVFLAFGLLAVSTAAGAQVAGGTARVLEVTLADLDEDALDFLIGWERWKGDVLDLASQGGSRYALVPLVPNLAPALALNARFAGRIFESAGQRPAGRVSPPARTRSRRPVRTARAPRDGASERGRPRPPRGTAPLGQLPRSPRIRLRGLATPGPSRRGGPMDSRRRDPGGEVGNRPPARPAGERGRARPERPGPGDPPQRPAQQTAGFVLPAGTGKIARSPPWAGCGDRMAIRS